MDYLSLSAWEIAEKIKNKEISAVEVTKLSIGRAKKLNETINGYITICEEEALKKASEVDAKIASGETLSPLAGVPYAMKDNICTKNILTTCASKMLYNFKPPYDAFVTKRLSDADCVLIGKTNMDEFAMGASNETSYFGPVRNPRNTDCVPGGSSGGSAAVVAADMAFFAIGSDTGGSVRQPASFCGVTGLKPTYGMVSRFGLIAFASSLDQIGPITKNPKDAALVMNIISAHDPMDSTSLDIKRPDYSENLDGDIKGLKIALPKEYFAAASEDVLSRIKDTVSALERLGAVVEEVSLPAADYALAAYYIISSAEASSNLARYDGVKYGFRAENFTDIMDMYRKTRGEGFGKEVKRRIMIGTYALSSGYYDAYYKKALQVRGLVKKSYDEIFEKFDIIASPVYSTTAFKLGEKLSDPVEMYANDLCTVSANIAGVPAISVPCGNGSDNLPIGIQLTGKPFAEDLLIKVANKIHSEGGRN
ncbi:MAG: Asp-tRNA(Asn)/Glu-tRNA(Gln) amidotransferase subunit GatA [Monoglobales bacterium]